MKTKILCLVAMVAALGLTGGLLAAGGGLVDVEAITGARMALAKSEDYSPMFGDDAGRKEALGLLQASDPADGIEAARAWLAKLPVDAEVLGALADAELRAGRYADSFAHRSEYYGLLASLAASGDGSKEKPWRVIAVKEEYVLLGELGARVQRQALTPIDGKPHDALDVTVGGESKTFYFDVSLSFEAMQRGFGK